MFSQLGLCCILCSRSHLFEQRRCGTPLLLGSSSHFQGLRRGYLKSALEDLVARRRVDNRPVTRSSRRGRLGLGGRGRRRGARRARRRHSLTSGPPSSLGLDSRGWRSRDVPGVVLRPLPGGLVGCRRGGRPFLVLLGRHGT